MSEEQKYYERIAYIEKQRENAIDLTHGLDNPNDSVRVLAEILFSKPPTDPTVEANRLIFDDPEMDIADLFCMLVEFILYGIDIASMGKSNIFMLENSTDEIVYVLRKYFQVLGFDMKVTEVLTIEDESHGLFRDRDDYFCEVTEKPPPFLCYPGWYVLNYRIINNRGFEFNSDTPLNQFKVFFLNKKKKLFSVNFDFISSI